MKKQNSLPVLALDCDSVFLAFDVFHKVQLCKYMGCFFPQHGVQLAKPKEFLVAFSHI